MRLIVLIFLALLTSITQGQTSSKPAYFPRILWTFWDSGYSGMPFFSKLCLNNMAYYAQKSGWELRFLSDANITQFISPANMLRIDAMYNTSKHELRYQNRADLIRLFLLYENGGMWLDTNSFFFGDFSWIQNFEKETWIYNRVSAKPQIITFTLSTVMGGNKTQVMDDKYGKVYVHPGVQIWSFIVLPKCKFLQDTINHLVYSLAKSRQQLDRQSQNLGILYDRQKDPYYITSNYQFQNVLQKKQKQLDKSTLSGHKYAVEYYKMWSIDGRTTVYGIFQGLNWFAFSSVFYMITNSLQNAQQSFNIPSYLVKFISQMYIYVNFFLTHRDFLNCLGVDVRISQNSIVNKYLISIAKDMPQVQVYFDQLQSRGVLKDHQCRHHDQGVFQLIENVKKTVYWYIFLILIVNIGILFVIVRKLKQKMDKKQFRAL